MKRSALLVLSSLLLTSASYAGNTKCEDCYDLSTKNAAALHHTTSKPNSAETKYWDDYIHSGQKDITVYVRDLSRKDAQAALWFITTGGKYGFAAREATAQERVLLEDAIKQVAISYGTRSNTGKGLQEWSQVSNANHAGHLHLQMIYKKIDDLNFKVNNLESEVKLLKAAQEKTDKKLASLSDTLIADSNARKEELQKFPSLLAKNSQDIKTMMDKYEENWKTTLTAWTTNLDKEREERENLRLAAVAEKTNYENKLVAQQLADKTAADAEKAKIQEEVNRQKGRKRNYKDQLSDYKEKEAEARIAKAVKEQHEAAALREKQRDEEIRREREAAAERERQRDEEIRKEREAAIERERAAAEREKKAANELNAFRAALLQLGRAHSGQQNINLEEVLKLVK